MADLLCARPPQPPDLKADLHLRAIKRAPPQARDILYGASEEAKRRLFSFMERAQAADEYLQSFHFASCDYCKVGWFGSTKEAPVDARQLSAVHKWNFLLAEPDEWPVEDGRRICVRCLAEVNTAKRHGATTPATAAAPASTEPQLFCAANDMDIEDTYPELDALTFFEEEILSPVQPMVRIYTLYGTGLTEMRGHVANWAQSGPQFVREIPARAQDLNILLIRRFPRDPNRKQRVPFVANPRRLEAALDRLEGRLGTAAHLGFHQHEIPIKRDNLADYKDDQEPVGLQVQVVDQGEDFMIDRDFFSRWIGSSQGEEACFQVNVLLRLHLDEVLGDEGAQAGSGDDGSSSDGATAAEGALWESRAWRRVCRDVARAETELQAVASKEKREGEEEEGDAEEAGADGDGAEVPPVKPVVRHRIKDVALARWLERTLPWNEQSSLLDVLRDELTTVQELEALQHPVESSGTWAPDELLGKKTEGELITEFKEDLVRAFPELEAEGGAAAPEPAAVSAPADIEVEKDAFDTAAMTRAEKASLERYGAARLAGAPLVDPPRAADTRIILREDTPFYISLGFLKIFQTGSADYWAFDQRRRERRFPVSLMEWFQHVLRHRSGRASRHPRFFYFAINTLLRNKAVRGKSFFVRKSVGAQAYEDFTPQELLGKSKAQMIRILCAYETKMPGSAAEKLGQRDDLEAMLQQLEVESEANARSELPDVRRELQAALAAAQTWHSSTPSGVAPKGVDAATAASADDLAEAIAIAHVELGETADDGPRDGEARDLPTVATSGSASGAAAAEGLRDLSRRHFRLRRCVEQRGEVPVHFITLTTAIYHWADLAQWLREYEERTTELRGGRQDPLEPGEDKVPEDKRRVLHHPGIVAWFCALKLELLVHYVRGMLQIVNGHKNFRCSDAA